MSLKFKNPNFENLHGIKKGDFLRELIKHIGKCIKLLFFIGVYILKLKIFTNSN